MFALATIDALLFHRKPVDEYGVMCYVPGRLPLYYTRILLFWYSQRTVFRKNYAFATAVSDRLESVLSRSHNV